MAVGETRTMAAAYAAGDAARPGDSAPRPRERRRRSRALDRDPRARRGDHRRRVRRLVPAGPRRRRRRRRSAHSGQLDRPDVGDRTGAWRARAANAEARSRTRVPRRSAVRARALHPDGRRRLHVRLPPARAVRREAARGKRVRDGIALAGLDREGRDAASCTSTSALPSPRGFSTCSTEARSRTSTAGCARSPGTRSFA